MSCLDTLFESVNLLEDYIYKNDYKGYDPYDALKSPIFRLPFFHTNKSIRFSIQQFVKRSPFNIRKLLLIEKDYNPVTLGLCIQAYSYLSKVFIDRKTEFSQKIELLKNKLIELKSIEYSGACWGYDFDWEHRYMKVPAYQPTIVATGIITNALFEHYCQSADTESFSLCKSSCDFVLNDLNRSYNGDTFCFSYSPFDTGKVLNASMKGVRLLAQVYSITGEAALLEAARKAVSYTINEQHEDGSWVYSDKRSRIDNYHTGYVLDCLDTYIKCSGERQYLDNLDIGFRFYKNNFFELNGFPKFFNNKIYPLDCTSGAQSILTLIRFKEIDLAIKVANYLIKNMQAKNGSFYFREFKTYKIKTSFMRWSQAWMLVALSNLIYTLKEK